MRCCTIRRVASICATSRRGCSRIGAARARAEACAEIHAAWPAVCERRGRMPDDELAYVEAWCLPKSTAGTIAALVPLFETGVGLAAARDAIVLVAATSATPEAARPRRRRAARDRSHHEARLARVRVPRGRPGRRGARTRDRAADVDARRLHARAARRARRGGPRSGGRAQSALRGTPCARDTSCSCARRSTRRARCARPSSRVCSPTGMPATGSRSKRCCGRRDAGAGAEHTAITASPTRCARAATLPPSRRSPPSRRACGRAHRPRPRARRPAGRIRSRWPRAAAMLASVSGGRKYRFRGVPGGGNDSRRDGFVRRDHLGRRRGFGVLGTLVARHAPPPEVAHARGAERGGLDPDRAVADGSARRARARSEQARRRRSPSRPPSPRRRSCITGPPEIDLVGAPPSALPRRRRASLLVPARGRGVAVRTCERQRPAAR